MIEVARADTNSPGAPATAQAMARALAWDGADAEARKIAWRLAWALLTFERTRAAWRDHLLKSDGFGASKYEREEAKAWSRLKAAARSFDQQFEAARSRGGDFELKEASSE